MIFLRDRIIGRLECGRTQLEVSSELGIAKSVISRLCQRFQDEGNSMCGDMLGRRIAARQPRPSSLPDFRRALFDEWCNIPQDKIDNLIISMPRRFQCSRAWHQSKRRRRWVGVKSSTRNERRYPKCSLARGFGMVREDTGDPSEGATCAWMAADEAVACTRAFFNMWWSS
ncbi:uncharacterized protein TNCV_1716531 [Trichonephila clavipes]|nr:uncharacterized protein TNCV_1716531 [Trichonephila clavipes]